MPDTLRQSQAGGTSFTYVCGSGLVLRGGQRGGAHCTAARQCSAGVGPSANQLQPLAPPPAGTSQTTPATGPPSGAVPARLAS